MLAIFLGHLKLTGSFVPEADFLKILRAKQLGAGHIKYPQNYREYLKFL